MNTPFRLVVTLLFIILLQGQAGAQTAAWSLKACVDRAIERNVQLNITRRTNDIYAVNLTQAQNAQFPTLGANASQAFNFGRTLDPSSYTYVNTNVNSNNFSVNSSVTLFQGNQLVNTIKADKLNYQAGKLDIETFKNNISLSVAGAYLQMLLDLELISNAKSNIATDQQQIDITHVKVTAGAVPELNMYQVKAQLSSDKLALTNAQNQYTLDKLTLEQLMDMPDTAGFDIEKPALADPPHFIDSSLTAAQIYDRSLERQPQIQSTEKKLLASMLGLDAAKGGRYPRLLLNGNIATAYSSARNRVGQQVTIQNEPIGYLQGNPDQLVYGQVPYTSIIRSDYPFMNQLKDNLSESFSFTLAMPIFNGYIVRSNIQQALINKDVAKLNDQYARDQFRKTIEQSFTDMTGANKQYISSLESFTSENEAYKIMNVKYKGGSASASDLILEKNRFVVAQSSVAQAKYLYIFKKKVLDFYLGNPITL